MGGWNHGDNSANDDTSPATSNRNARQGMFLFVLYLAFYAGFVLIAAFAPASMAQRPWARHQSGHLVWLRHCWPRLCWWRSSIAGCAAGGRVMIYTPSALAVTVFGLFVALTLGLELLLRRPHSVGSRATLPPADRFPGSSTAWPLPETICRPRRFSASAA